MAKEQEIEGGITSKKYYEGHIAKIFSKIFVRCPFRELAPIDGIISYNGAVDYIHSHINEDRLAHIKIPILIIQSFNDHRVHATRALNFLKKLISTPAIDLISFVMIRQADPESYSNDPGTEGHGTPKDEIYTDQTKDAITQFTNNILNGSKPDIKLHQEILKYRISYWEAALKGFSLKSGLQYLQSNIHQATPQIGSNGSNWRQYVTNLCPELPFSESDIKEPTPQEIESSFVFRTYHANLLKNTLPIKSLQIQQQKDDILFKTVFDVINQNTEFTACVESVKKRSKESYALLLAHPFLNTFRQTYLHYETHVLYFDEFISLIHDIIDTRNKPLPEALKWASYAWDKKPSSCNTTPQKRAFVVSVVETFPGFAEALNKNLRESPPLDTRPSNELIEDVRKKRLQLFKSIAKQALLVARQSRIAMQALVATSNGC